MHDILPDFIYCLNLNILFYSAGITISPKSFLGGLKLIFCAKRINTIQTINITTMF